MHYVIQMMHLQSFGLKKSKRDVVCSEKGERLSLIFKIKDPSNNKWRIGMRNIPF